MGYVSVNVKMITKSKRRIQILLDELTNTFGKPKEDAIVWALTLETKG